MGASIVEHLLVKGPVRAAALLAPVPPGGLGPMVVIRAVENTETVHNVIVCTLCSCYPWPVLGLPPTWYKSAPYRSRAVIEPRGVLREFGLDLNEAVAIRVWDSTAEVRYLVLPERPAGTAGWSAASPARSACSTRRSTNPP